MIPLTTSQIEVALPFFENPGPTPSSRGERVFAECRRADLGGLPSQIRRLWRGFAEFHRSQEQ